MTGAFFGSVVTGSSFSGGWDALLLYYRIIFALFV